MRRILCHAHTQYLCDAKLYFSVNLTEFVFKMKPDMWDFLQKCGKDAKMQYFPHDRGTIDTHDI